jgi:hypothetical protein
LQYVHNGWKSLYVFEGAASMVRVRGGIRVKDKDGVLFTVITRERVLTGLGLPRKVVRFELETGELLDFVDANTFVLTSTGKKLRRVRRVKERPEGGGKSPRV